MDDNFLHIIAEMMPSSSACVSCRKILTAKVHWHTVILLCAKSEESYLGALRRAEDLSSAAEVFGLVTRKNHATASFGANLHG